MKVAVVGAKGLPASGGVERVVEAISKRMVEKGLSITVYSDSRFSTPHDEYSGIHIIHISTPKGKYLRAIWQNLYSAFHAVFFGRYDLIHLHNIEASFILPCLRLRFPVLSTSHGFAYWRGKWSPLAKWMMQLMNIPFIRLSNLTTSVSSQNALELSRRFNRDVKYIPNGVGDEYAPNYGVANQILEENGLSPNKYFLFVAGRIEPTKGAHRAIEAVNDAAEDLSLLIIGDLAQVPEYGNSLKECAGPRIHFQDPIAAKDVLFGLMAQAYCLIFPSEIEAMSMVLLEAASLGVPILCSDIPENRSVMVDDVWYFDLNKPGDLGKQLSRLLQSEKTIKEMGQRASARIKSDHSWDRIANMYIDLYKEVLGHNGER